MSKRTDFFGPYGTNIGTMDCDCDECPYIDNLQNNGYSVAKVHGANGIEININAFHSLGGRILSSMKSFCANCAYKGR